MKAGIDFRPSFFAETTGSNLMDFCQTFIQLSALNLDGNRRPGRIYLAYQQSFGVNNVA
jgi:hypothetical protein